VARQLSPAHYCLAFLCYVHLVDCDCLPEAVFGVEDAVASELRATDPRHIHLRAEGGLSLETLSCLLVECVAKAPQHAADALAAAAEAYRCRGRPGLATDLLQSVVHAAGLPAGGHPMVSASTAVELGLGCLPRLFCWTCPFNYVTGEGAEREQLANFVGKGCWDLLS